MRHEILLLQFPGNILLMKRSQGSPLTLLLSCPWNSLLDAKTSAHHRLATFASQNKSNSNAIRLTQTLPFCVNTKQHGTVWLLFVLVSTRPWLLEGHKNVPNSADWQLWRKCCSDKSIPFQNRVSPLHQTLGLYIQVGPAKSQIDVPHKILSNNANFELYNTLSELIWKWIRKKLKSEMEKE